MNQEQEIYVGMYRDYGECKLDMNSASSVMYKAVNQFYDDMTEAGITDGSYADDSSDEQIDDLNQSECDMVTIAKSDVPKLDKLL